VTRMTLSAMAWNSGLWMRMRRSLDTPRSFRTGRKRLTYANGTRAAAQTYGLRRAGMTMADSPTQPGRHADAAAIAADLRRVREAEDQPVLNTRQVEEIA
jgi:hypothetical protein